MPGWCVYLSSRACALPGWAYLEVAPNTRSSPTRRQADSRTESASFASWHANFFATQHFLGEEEGGLLEIDSMAITAEWNHACTDSYHNRGRTI
jgi:hypothetical protein